MGAPSATPLPGHCGAKVKSGNGYCTHFPVNGTARCAMHGGNSTGAPVVTGRFSRHFKVLGDKGQALITELEADPELLNPTWVAAVQAYYAIEAAGLSNEEEILTKVVTARAKSTKPVTLEEVRAEFLTFKAKLAESAGRAQESANKQANFKAVMIEGMVPIMQSLGAQIRRLVCHYVTDPAQQEQFLRDLDRALLASLGKAQDAQ